MKVLVVSTLYPNQANPKHGIFIHQRVKQVLAHHADVQIKVLAPVPWFPFTSDRFGQYGRWARAPQHEIRDDIEIWHPRYPVIPKIGMHLAPHALGTTIRRSMKRLRDDGFDFQLVDGHYYYPDGVAIAHACTRTETPFVMTARGSDIAVIPGESDKAKRAIQGVFSKARRNIGVCQALVDTMVQELGAPADKAVVARNGVDLNTFEFADEARHRALQSKLGLKKRHLCLSVGHLVEGKGHHIALEAIAGMPDAELWILGVGPMREALESQVVQLSLQNRVRFLGEMAQPDMVKYYQAADVMVLASRSEGWANVLLEAMACGTPVVATRVGGTPEVVPEHEQHYLTERTAEAIAAALNERLAAQTPREEMRRHAEKFSWKATSNLLYSTWRAVIDGA